MPRTIDLQTVFWEFQLCTQHAAFYPAVKPSWGNSKKEVCAISMNQAYWSLSIVVKLGAECMATSNGLFGLWRQFNFGIESSLLLDYA